MHQPVQVANACHPERVIQPSGSHFGKIVIRSRTLRFAQPLPNDADESEPGVGSPVITGQPETYTVIPGETATFSVSALSPTTPSYRWFKNMDAIPTGTNSLLILTNVQAADKGYYTVVVQNEYGSVPSSSAGLVVIEPPSVIFQSQSQTKFAGECATFEVVAAGSQPISYRWRKDGTNITDETGISGIDSAMLTICNLQPKNGGSYSVVLTNSAGDVTSVVGTLTVVSPPTLGYKMLDGDVVLNWPTEFTGFVLECSTNLQTTNWNVASPSPVIVGGQNVVTNPMTGEAKFYRLKKGTFQTRARSNMTLFPDHGSYD